jgi:hypothetical protein
MTPPPPLRVAAYLVGVAGLAFCITLLWFGMRAVLDIGGFCASGGPYVIATECPDAVIATTPLSILGGFLAVGLMLWGGSGLGAGWIGLVFLAWPALFISLGWNFLQYAVFPPEGGLIWSWVICGVLFVAIGAVPLWVAIAAFRDGPEADERAYAAGRVVVRPRPQVTPIPPPIPPDGRPDSPIVERLERLAALRRRGDITNAEYETAKAATLAESAREGGP